jgi:hypothetical protein
MKLLLISLRSDPLHQIRAQPLYFLEGDGGRDHV